MKVIVLGTGCPTCQRLYKDVSEVMKELNVDGSLEKIEDLQKIMSYGIMSVPALVIDEQLQFVGRAPGKEELKKYFVKDDNQNISCSCGGNC
jgi:small redox-active disulfide protein 2